MCLRTVNFTLDAKNVGIGYKVIPSDEITVKENGSFVMSSPYWSKQWRKSPGHKYYSTQKFLEDAYSKQYRIGYHIFLNKQDAVKYKYVASGYVVQVSFKDVLAFGTNETTYDSYGPCIIADKMKVDKVLYKVSNQKIKVKY